MIKEKVDVDQRTIFQDANYEITEQNESEPATTKEINDLPYIFKDPVKFDKKVEPKTLSFGSKIDDSPIRRERYYTVKEIISPEILILNNGLKIRLLGVRERGEDNGDAVQFLKDRTRGQKVSIKFDSTKHDDEDTLLCYLYLKNKTFVNAHLIKNDLVDADVTRDYKYKTKFLTYGRGV